MPALGSRRGRRGRTARRGAGARRVRAAAGAGSAVVDAHPGRRTADADLPDPRQGGHRRRQQRDRLARGRRRRARPGHRALPVRRRPDHRAEGRHPSRASAAPRCPATTSGSRCRSGCGPGATAPAGPTERSSAPTRATARSAPGCSTRCRPCWCCGRTSGTPRWSTCWPPKPAATDRVRRPTSTGCSTCC